MGQARGVCWSLSVTKGVLKTVRGNEQGGHIGVGLFSRNL